MVSYQLYYNSAAIDKKKEKVFEDAVKPFFHPSKECYLIYSPNIRLTSDSKYLALTPKKIEAKHGFKLLCDDLKKSVREAENFRFKQGFTTPIPSAIKELTHYSIELGTLNLFVLHKSSSKMGLGIATYSALSKGLVVAEYVGERKDSHIKISENSYVFLNNDGTNIDANKYGNVARFFNHCPYEHSNEQVLTANLAVVPWQVSATVTKVFFLTISDIKAFEPLCWDYGDKYKFDFDVELLNAEAYLPIKEDYDL
jgi:hypothetical protein